MLRYSRSYLLSLCFWWRRAFPASSQSSRQSLNHQRFGPLSPDVWNSLKSSGLLRITRGKRGGQRLTTHRQSLSLTLEVCDSIVQQTKSLNIQNCNSTLNEAANRNNIADKNNITKLPNFCLLNSRSLLYKVDELAIRLNASPFSFVAVTESWLNGDIEDHLLSIQGYNIYRRDRAFGRGGGVCAFVADGIPTKHRFDLESASFEALWRWLRPHRLPRPLSGILCCVLYNPPGATSQQFPDCGVVI